MTERWKDITGYEGKYQVSSHGRIRSLTRTVARKLGTFTLKGQIIVPWKSSHGYWMISPCWKQKRKAFSVHDLVCRAFIGPRPRGMVIDHIDGDRLNNRLDNLHYVTPKQNQRKRKDAKLTEAHAAQIKMLSETKSQQKIAEQFGVSQAMVSKIVTGRLWANG